MNIVPVTDHDIAVAGNNPSQAQDHAARCAAYRRSASPRGYRELRSPAEMRKLLKRKVVEQDRKCAICHEEFTDDHDVVPDHKNPKRNGRRLAR
jgi:hypothetical protein